MLHFIRRIAYLLELLTWGCFDCGVGCALDEASNFVGGGTSLVVGFAQTHLCNFTVDRVNYYCIGRSWIPEPDPLEENGQHMTPTY
ncbi:hypothetical protein Ocin01_02995 [Orchesella cincta]|uniref:Secreted protein n=1 Tax=Orchesella cincta TaxID=48709 RepID=A0A1D2NEI7_ORCCI|nr:hypothetical protein Ocin01_02995 [Orchesella cincta]